MLENLKEELREKFQNKGHLAFALMLLSVFIAFGIWIFFGTLLAEPACGDGTLYSSCSEDRPYFCEQGVLIEKASVCGCPDGNGLNFTQEGDFCVTGFHTGPLDMEYAYVLDGKQNALSFTTFKGLNDYVSELPRQITYLAGQNISRQDFKLKALNDSVQRETILPLVKKIQNLAPSSKTSQARIAVSLIQKVPYNFSNKTIKAFGSTLNYTRYPYEVLHENQGICESKSQLLALILKELGFETVIFYFPEENHEAIGIACPEKHSFNNTGFCFVETSGPAIISDSGIEYSGGIFLNSEPQISIISSGLALPEGLDEYEDAQDLNNIRERNFFGFLRQQRITTLEKKYNLAEEYNLR